MANGVRTYQLIINGLTESISAVDSLNKQLDALDKKITALQGKAVNVSAAASSGGGGGSRTSELSDEDKLLKQIEATQSKINQADMADYKVLLDKKQELKELVKEQKSMTAEARLSDGAYENTMLGMKQHLADIKAAMQTVDLGDTDTFEKLTKDANELNAKLLEIEKSYGQFGRNVGNYASAAEGFKGLKIEVGGISEEFENARQAYMTLKREMQTLATKKDLGIITDEETERLKSLIPTVKQLESSIQDAGKPMDRLMDSMQSIVAIAQAGKGLAAFFGLEDTGIEKSIQDLVALQNAMQGLQTIQKQLQAGDGIFKWLNKGNASIDNFTKKLFGVKKATTEVTTASKAQAAATSTVATASKAATTAEVAQTTATAGLTIGMGAATVAAKLLSTALKAIGIGFLLEGISLAIDGIKSLVSWITSESDAEKKAAKAAKEHADMVKAGSEAYANAAAKVKQYQLRIDAFNGSAKQEKKLVEELNNEFGNQIGHYKSLEEWKKALIEQAPAYLETLKNEAILTQLAAKYAEIYAQKLQTLEIFKFSTKLSREAIEKYFNEQLSDVDQMMAELIEGNQSLYNSLGDAASETVTTIKNANKEILDVEKDLNNLRMKNMKDGLVKKLIQLEEEKRQTLNKLKSNNKAYLEAEKAFEERRLDLIKDYVEDVSKRIAASTEGIASFGLNADKSKLEAEANDIALTIEEGLRKIPPLEKQIGRPLKDSFKNVGSSMTEFYQTTVKELKNYVRRRYDLLITAADKEVEAQQEAEKKRYEDERDKNEKLIKDVGDSINAIISLRARANQQLTNADKENLKKLEEQQRDANKNSEKIEENHWRQMEVIERNHLATINKLMSTSDREEASVDNQHFTARINDFRRYLSEINRLRQQQPEVDSFGIVNKKETKKNYKEIIEAIKETYRQIDEIVKEAEEKLKDENPDLFNALISAAIDAKNSLKDIENDIYEDMNDIGRKWWESLQIYIQAVADAAQQIMSSIWDYQDNVYDRQVRDIEKQIDEQQKLLDKQKDIIQKHSDAVNSIEDELSSARGDRRQHLIDQLNEEIAAQRAAAAEEKRLEKEKEKLEKQKEKMAKDQWEKEKARDITTAIMNAAMAISQAATNKWPIPAIPLMSIAAAVGAAQVAAIEAQRYPYAKGGLLEGPSHSQGGIPVGNTGIEVEGGEFVTNKKTTEQNTPLLEYINSKKKRIDLSDMIEFFNDKPRATIKNIRSKFADGGVLTTPSVDISEQLQNIVINQDNRPIYVSVVDINNKQADVRRVQALAGL